MRRTVGVLVMEHIAVGLVENHKVVGSLNVYPEQVPSLDPLQSMPAEGEKKSPRLASASRASFATASSRIHPTSSRPKALLSKLPCLPR